MPEWKFVTNHALVLCLIAQQARITAREISAMLRITEKTTRSIITDLDAEGYITRNREGRRTRYCINLQLPLRSELPSNRAISELMELLGWRKEHSVAEQVVKDSHKVPVNHPAGE